MRNGSFCQENAPAYRYLQTRKLAKLGLNVLNNVTCISNLYYIIQTRAKIQGSEFLIS